MKIEIGKTYNVCNKWKKTYEEVEYFAHDDGRRVSVTTLWRSGSINITPQNEDEVEWLTDAIDSEDTFEPYMFEEYEFCDCWDGISEDLDFHGEWKEEDKDTITKTHEEEDEFISSILEEKFEFSSEDAEVFIHNGILVEEETRT
jgi:hypothetical protein